MAKEIKYEVKENFGAFGKRGYEVRLVSWNDGDPKYDIRQWYTDDTETERCRKGIALTKEEVKELAKIIDGIE